MILVIHGGGWQGFDPVQYRAALDSAVAYQRFGFATLTVDYRRGLDGVADIERFYSIARQRFGSQVPVCAFGSSAGGHLALLLAARHPELTCAISMGGPTDLVRLARQPGFGSDLDSLFGRARLASLSPALHAGAIRAAVLLVYARNDPIVPISQAEELRRADPRARLLALPAGPTPFLHSSVATAARARALAEIDQFLSEQMPRN